MKCCINGGKFIRVLFLLTELFKFEIQKCGQILCAHKPYFLMPGHMLTMSTCMRSYAGILSPVFQLQSSDMICAAVFSKVCHLHFPPVLTMNIHLSCTKIQHLSHQLISYMLIKANLCDFEQNFIYIYINRKLTNSLIRGVGSNFEVVRPD